jgi:hypothetical protein
MRLILAVSCASAVAAAACSYSPQATPSSGDATAYVQPVPSRNVVAQRNLLMAADRQIRQLELARTETHDSALRRVVDRDILTIAARRDVLIDLLTIGDGRPHGRRISAAASNLDRAVRAGAAAEMQAHTAEP